ncbi:MAG: CDP-archaeol synthase [Granulosicoccus sp.]|nr:CDP-archaeol synthase [Granulosicoccus sp.]
MLILVLVCANGAPIIARKLLSSRFDTPLDGGLIFLDGKRLLGSSKTIRGLLAATLVSAVMFLILELGVLNGLFFGLSAMLGDSLSSFLKRRAGLNPGDSVPWLDQIPEALVPALVVRGALQLDWIQLVVVVVGFTLVNMLISPVTYWLHIRRRPH